MLILSIIILLTVAGFYFYSLHRPREWLKSLDRKEHILCHLYPMTELILTIPPLDTLLRSNREVSSSIKALKATSRQEIELRLFLYRKLASVIVILSLFAFISILGEIGNKGTSLLREGRYLARPEAGEGNGEVSLDVTIEDAASEETKAEDGRTKRRIDLAIAERVYTDEELGLIFEEGKEYILNHVLGNNSSMDAVEENLSFCKTIPDTGINVIWEPEDNSLLRSDGTVCNEELVQGKRTSLTAILSYGERHTSLCMYLQIIPKKYSAEEELNQKLSEAIKRADQETLQAKEIKLPEYLDKHQLTWSEEKGSAGRSMLLVGILLAIVAWYASDLELKKQMKHRREQLLMDYPEIINKFTLLVNAGMTARQAWFKITEDYHERLKGGISPKHYAYEEMLITANELKLGLTESSAYEQYGRRINLLPYIKFGSLITQNLKKGNKGFTELLRKEAIEAFEDRKEMAKRLGEEAGTKLLMPMMLMLVIVFLIILIPAFIAFRM